jgi:hypothetical protein
MSMAAGGAAGGGGTEELPAPLVGGAGEGAQPGPNDGLEKAAADAPLATVAAPPVAPAPPTATAHGPAAAAAAWLPRHDALSVALFSEFDWSTRCRMLRVPKAGGRSCCGPALKPRAATPVMSIIQPVRWADSPLVGGLGDQVGEAAWGDITPHVTYIDDI